MDDRSNLRRLRYAERKEKAEREEKTERTEETAKEKRYGFFEYLLRCLSLVISIAVSFFSILSTIVEWQQNKQNTIFGQTNLEVSRDEQSFNYQISDVDDTYELPAYETNFTNTTGAFQEFAQIYYDGTNLKIANTSLDILESGNYVIDSEGQIPKQNYVSDELIYDYYFIYTVSASGQKELWLVYYELDLGEKTVKGPVKTDDVILLALEDEPESPKREMLENYQKLYEIVNTLPSI